MNIKQAIFSNLFWKLAGIIFLFLNNLLIVRTLGAESSGRMFLTIAYLTLFITGLRLGLETGIVYLNTRLKVSSTGLFFFFIPILILQAEIVIAVLKFIPEARQQFPTKMATIYIVSNVAINYLAAFYSSRKMFRSYNIINGIFQILLCGVLFIIYRLADKVPPESYAWLSQVIFRQMAIICALTSMYLAIYYYYVNRSDFRVLKLSKTTIKYLFRHSYLIYISNILFYLITRSDLYFVDRFSLPLDLGNYVQAGKFGQMLLVLPGVLASVVFPYSIQSSAAFAKKVALICKAISVLFAAIFIGVLLTGKFLFPWLLGEEFTSVYGVLLILIPGIYFMGINQILMSYFEGKHRQKFVLVASILNLILLIGLNMIFAPKYGFLACAIIFTLSTFFSNLFLMMQFKKTARLSYSDIFSIPISEIKNFRFR